MTMPAPPPAGVSSTVAVPADPELADGDGVERPQALLQGLARQRRRQRPGKQLGKQRQHGCPPGRAHRDVMLQQVASRASSFAS